MYTVTLLWGPLDGKILQIPSLLPTLRFPELPEVKWDPGRADEFQFIATMVYRRVPNSRYYVYASEEVE